MSIKISELPLAVSVNNADIIPIVQNGQTMKAAVSSLPSGRWRWRNNSNRN